MAAAVLLEKENMDRGGRRKRKEGTGLTAKGIPWAVGDGDLETTAAKRKRREAVTVEAYISVTVERRTSCEGRRQPWKEAGPIAREGSETVSSHGSRRWAEGGMGREEKIDGEGWLRRRHRAKKGEGEGRDRWSRKRQEAALKLDGGEGGVSRLRRRRRADGGENRREEGRAEACSSARRRRSREGRRRTEEGPATAMNPDGDGILRKREKREEIGSLEGREERRGRSRRWQPRWKTEDEQKREERGGVWRRRGSRWREPKGRG